MPELECKMIKSTKNVFLIVLITGASSMLHAQGTWQVVGQMPRPVWGGDAFTHDSSIIVLGGQDTLLRTVNWIQMYRPHVQSWQIVGGLRRPRQDFVADRDSTRAYIVGGRASGMGGPRDSTIEVFDLPPPSQSFYLDTNRFFVRMSPAGVVHNGFLYIFGGFRAPGIPFIVEYDLNSRTVTFHRDTLLNISGQMAATIGDDIYLFGGELSPGTLTNKIWRFNAASRTLHELPQAARLQAPRAYGKAIRLGDQNRIMILGGRNEAGALNSVEIFEVLPGTPPTYQLSQATPSLFPRVACMAVYLHGSVYVFGGRDQSHAIRPIERYDVPTSVPDDDVMPTEYALLQNFPNPFNSSTNVQIWMPRGGESSLKVFNLLGGEVATLYDGILSPGKHRFVWDAIGLPSGIYLYQLRSGSYKDTKKMILLR